MAKKYQKYRIVALTGILGVLFYVLHVFLGQAAYPGYRAASQAVSELSAIGAPSRMVALLFFSLYSLCMIVFALGLWMLFRDRISGTFSIGCLLLLGTYVVSWIGCLFFPPAQSLATGFWKNVAHLILNGGVMLFSVAALLFIGLGVWKRYRWLSLFSFFAIFMVITGMVLSGLVGQMYVGAAQRISAFALVLYDLLLAVWMMRYRPRTLNWY